MKQIKIVVDGYGKEENDESILHYRTDKTASPLKLNECDLFTWKSHSEESMAIEPVVNLNSPKCSLKDTSISPISVNNKDKNSV